MSGPPGRLSTQAIRLDDGWRRRFLQRLRWAQAIGNSRAPGWEHKMFGQVILGIACALGLTMSTINASIAQPASAQPPAIE